METADPIDLIKSAFHHDDAIALRDLLIAHPDLKSHINQPLFPFDSPAIVHARSREMLDVLLDAGADINARSTWWAGGFGLLDFADPDLAVYAIGRGATVDIHAAARLGLFDRLKELIAADPEQVHSRGGDGQTALHFAGSIEIADYLLNHGADIDARDIDHESTPAQYMIRDRQPIARFLVDRGAKTDLLMAAALGDLALVQKYLEANPNHIRMTVSEQYFPKQNPSSGGTIYTWTLGSNKSPHQIAREFNHDEIHHLLMDRSPAELKLVLACLSGHESTLNALLKDHPDFVKTLSEDDRRAVVTAAQENNTAAVARMLAIGFPVDIKGQHGGTPLHWAAFHGNTAMTQEILKHNPPLEAVDHDYHATPLGWATHGSQNGWHRKTGDYAKVVELLCKAGAVVPKELYGTEPVKQVLRGFQKL
jgi:ankyrin repeat protein